MNQEFLLTQEDIDNAVDINELIDNIDIPDPLHDHDFLDYIIDND